jgi:hypothetical protein
MMSGFLVFTGAFFILLLFPVKPEKYRHYHQIGEGDTGQKDIAYDYGGEIHF